MHIRPLDRQIPAEIELVAQRMMATLIEVLGPERGQSLYSMDWLQERARFHLDPAACTGEIFVAEHETILVGHTIVRIEAEQGQPYGYFSTTYVLPAWRRQNVAHQLLDAGEAWMHSHGLARSVTNTSATNWPLIGLYERRGYAITLRSDDGAMVRLTRDFPVCNMNL